MKTDPERSRRNFTAAIWTVFGLAFGNLFFYTLHTASTFIRNDEWRQFKFILIPILNNHAPLITLLKNHHPYPFLHIVQILNMYLFNYRPEYQALFGLIFQNLTGILLIWMLLRATVETFSPLMRFCFCAFVSLSIFGFNSSIVYTWPAIGVLQFFMFLFVIFCFTIDAALQKESKILIALSFFLSIILLFINGDFGTIFVAAVLPAVILAKGFRWNKSLRIVSIFFLMIIAYRAMLYLLKTNNTAETTNNIATFLAKTDFKIFDILGGYALGITSGLVNFNDIINNFPWSKIPLIAFAILIASLHILIIVIYIKNKKPQDSLFPIITTIIGFLFCASLVVFRIALGDTMWVFPSPRYGSVYRLICVGSLFALPSVWQASQSWKASRRKIAGAALCSAAAVSLILQLTQTLITWNRAHIFADINERHPLSIALAALKDEGDLTLPRNIVGSNNNLDAVLDFIQQRKLNVFSENMAGSRYLKNFMECRSQYLGSDQTLFVLAELDSSLGQWRQGPISLTLDENGLALANGSARRVVARVAITAQDYSGRGLAASMGMPGQTAATETLDLLAGTQAHYFYIEGDHTLNLTIPGDASFRSVNVKPAKEP